MSKLVEAGKLYGRATYPGTTPTQQAIIAYGMTPKELVDKAEAFGREELAKAYARSKFGDESQYTTILDYIEKQPLAEFTRGFCLGLMQSAAEKGRMVA